MTSVSGIPSYVLQNMSMIQENLKSVMADNIGVGGSKADFDSFLESAIGDMDSTFSDIGFDGISYRDKAYDAMPGVSGNATQFDAGELMKDIQTGNKPNITNPESKAVVDKAYSSLLNGDMAKQLSPQIASATANDETKSVLDKLKNITSGNNTSLVTDEEFFDANSLTPAQITDLLKKKGSPYAYQTFEGGKSIGQLIYDECHKAGSVEKGSNTLNPALVLAIMGAESSFGTDSRTHKNNPFNIRINGSFDNVKSFEQSLNMAVNTMYNWAVNRPQNSKVSFLDYAGDKYCEDYTKDWKPNVEKYFTEFSVLNPIASQKKEENQKTQLLNQMVSSLGNSNPMLKGMNMESLMKTATNQEGGEQNILSNLNLVSGLQSSAMMEESGE